MTTATGGPTRLLPFTGVDNLMRALDEPRRPQTIELEVAVGGRLDDQRLRDAVGAAADRHPMARARQVRSKPLDLNYAWHIDSTWRRDPVEVCTVAETAELDATRDAFYSQHIDLEVGPPFRVLLVHEGDVGDRVMLSVNHSAFDGVGTLRLLQSISRSYAGEVDSVPSIDAFEARTFLEDRPRPTTTSRAAASGSLGDMLTPPARLASSGPAKTPGFGILHLDLDAADALGPGEATVNDVLMTALHLSIESWNKAQGAACDRVTVMMPVNQRPASWRSEILANLVLPGQVTSSRSDRSRPADLLVKVASQTRQIKTRGVDNTPSALPRRVPVLLRQLLPHVIDGVADRTADTAVLSNLGRVPDPPWFGNSGRGLWFSPPPRRPVVLTVGAATVGEKLTIGLRWCNDSFSATAARQFAETFTAMLGAVSGER
ncbi:MAG: hypothetical protein M3R71_02125 [Actinomycetota bacterium]|nr:hypothetical protein [Actinomycetota bacterium]